MNMKITPVVSHWKSPNKCISNIDHKCPIHLQVLFPFSLSPLYYFCNMILKGHLSNNVDLNV